MTEDAKTRILEAAQRLFAYRGYGSTSMREVAEAAGVTKPTLYYYFKNKEGMFREIVQLRSEGLQELVQAHLTAEGPPLARLRSFMHVYVLGALEDTDAMRLMMTCSLPGAHGTPVVDVVGRHLKNVEPLCGILTEAMEAGQLHPRTNPRVAIMGLLGAAHLHLLAALNGAPLIPQDIDAFFDTWLYGVTP